MLSPLALVVVCALTPPPSPTSPAARPRAQEIEKQPSKKDLTRAVRRLRGKKASTREGAIETLMAGGAASVPLLIRGHSTGSGSVDHRLMIRRVLLRLALVDDDALGALAAQLNADDRSLGLTAGRALLLARSEAAVPLLQALAREGPAEGKRAALQLLGEHGRGAHAAAPLLISTVDGADDACLRESAGRAIARSGLATPEALAAIGRRLEDPADARWVLEIAADLGAEGRRILLEALGRTQTSLAAARELASMAELAAHGATELLGAMVAEARAEPTEPRLMGTLTTLCTLSDPEAAPEGALELALEGTRHDSAAVRAEAYMAAANLGGPTEPVIEALSHGLASETSRVAVVCLLAAVSTLEDRAPALHMPLLECWVRLNDAKSIPKTPFTLAMEATGCLEVNSEERVDVLMEIVRTGTFSARTVQGSISPLAVTLGSKPGFAIPALAEALEEVQDSQRREQITLALGCCGKGAVDALLPLTENGHLGVSTMATLALCLTGSDHPEVLKQVRRHWGIRRANRMGLAGVLGWGGATLGPFRAELLRTLDEHPHYLHQRIVEAVARDVDSQDLGARLGQIAADSKRPTNVRVAALEVLGRGKERLDVIEGAILGAIEPLLADLPAAAEEDFGPAEPVQFPRTAPDPVLQQALDSLGRIGRVTAPVTRMYARLLGSTDANALGIAAAATVLHPALAPAGEPMVPSLLTRRSGIARSVGGVICEQAESLDAATLAALARELDSEEGDDAVTLAWILARCGEDTLDHAAVCSLLHAVGGAHRSKKVLERTFEPVDGAPPLAWRLRVTPVLEAGRRPAILDLLARSSRSSPAADTVVRRMISRWSTSPNPELVNTASELLDRLER